MFTSPKPLRSYFTIDSSTIGLLLANLLIISFAYFQQWTLSTVIWIYWAQSVIIGIFNVVKILHLKNFTTEGVHINHKPLLPDKSAKIKIAIFFAAHYGFFHLGYAIFFADMSPIISTQIYWLALSILIFFSDHLYSFIKNFKHETEKEQNIGHVMLFPYVRIIPMHLLIMLGAGMTQEPGAGALLFLVLKTIADVVMHQIEHA